ncbi:MAG: hypothetical protein GYB64_04890 [Chloroflexi bacterium]|nr:hypothetical protein [Chloroflexota bacterium]
MQAWEHCILTAIETQDRTEFMVALESGTWSPKGASSRLDVMAELGKQGWELVGIRPLGPGVAEFYFKRPRTT